MRSLKGSPTIRNATTRNTDDSQYISALKREQTDYNQYSGIRLIVATRVLLIKWLLIREVAIKGT